MIRVDERVAAIQTDMLHTGEYIAERFHDQNIYIQEHHTNIGNALKLHQEGIGDALELHHSNTAAMIGSLQEQITALETKISSLENHVMLDLSVEIMSHSGDQKSLVVATTLNGVLTDATMTVNAVDSSGLTLVSTTLTALPPGRAIHAFTSSASVFSVDAVVTSDGEPYTQSRLVSFL